MDSLHQRHEDWLINKTVKLVFVNLLTWNVREREGGRLALLKLVIIMTFSYRIPPHLENVPILTLDSSPEFETDENRRKELMKQVR